MKLSKKLSDALSEQMNFEFLSERVYRVIEAYFDAINLDNLKALMHSQADGEHEHGMKFYDYILDRLGTPDMTSAVGTFPYKTPTTVADALSLVYEHEQKVTQRIWDLAELSEKEGDHATCVFLQWFITEQVEEERTAEKWSSLAASLSNNPVGMLLLDHAAELED